MTLPGYLLSQTPKPDRPPLSPEDVLNQERKTSQMPSGPCWLKKGIYLPKQEKVFRQSINTKVCLSKVLFEIACRLVVNTELEFK